MKRTMPITEILRNAIQALLRNWGRAVLTSLSMVVGTASLVLVVITGISGRDFTLETIEGVGTNLITSSGDSSLDGVYKLVAVRDDSRWVPAIKISENPDKIPNPGHKHVWRIYDERGHATADLLSLDDENLQADEITLRHPSDAQSSRQLNARSISEIEPLLVDVVVDGDILYELPSIDEIRALRDSDLEKLDSGVKRIMNPHVYHVSLTQRLWDLKQELIKEFYPRAKQE